VNIYGSYRKNIPGVPFFEHPVYYKIQTAIHLDISLSEQEAQLSQRNSASATYDYLGWSTDLLMITQTDGRQNYAKQPITDRAV